MTRKDYVKIAEVLKNSKPSGEESPQAHTRWGGLVYRMATMLAEDNKRFDEDKFIQACGMDKWV